MSSANNYWGTGGGGFNAQALSSNLDPYARDLTPQELSQLMTGNNLLPNGIGYTAGTAPSETGYGVGDNFTSTGFGGGTPASIGYKDPVSGGNLGWDPTTGKFLGYRAGTSQGNPLSGLSDLKYAAKDLAPVGLAALGGYYGAAGSGMLGDGSGLSSLPGGTEAAITSPVASASAVGSDLGTLGGNAAQGLKYAGLGSTLAGVNTGVGTGAASAAGGLLGGMSTSQAVGLGSAALGAANGLLGGPSAPSSPNFSAAANANTQANRVNSNTPYGSLTYTQDPNNPNSWTQNVTLAPAQQQLLDQQNATSLAIGGLQNNAVNKVAGAMNTPLPSAYDPTQATNNAADLINQRLLPQQQRDKAALENQLANQGVTQGSEAYNNAMDQLGRTQNDARQQAQLYGINLGMTQQGQTFDQTNQNLNTPLNQLNALRSGSQVTNPTFSQAPTAGDQSQAAALQNQYNLGLYNSQIGSNNSLMNGLFSLGSSALLSNNKNPLSSIFGG